MHMQAVMVTSGGKTACYISDLIPTTAHIDLTWVMAFDLYPASDDRQPQAVLRAGDAGEVADGLYARSQNAVGLCGKSGDGPVGGESGVK